jgi:uracil-DNA glycosylase family 4
VNALSRINDDIIRCRRCPRLVAWREEAASTKVARFRDERYWGKPVPAMGDPAARLLIVGLAPAAHGANRTGRLFTGDRSGEWLFRALHAAGFASQPESVSREDGLTLVDCYVTAAARCAPPGNKLLPAELAACRPFLLDELQALTKLRVVVVLGKVACDATVDAFRLLERTDLVRRPVFGHGVAVRLNERQTLIASFHPSQQNTFTGKLTRPMFDAVFRKANRILTTH